MRRIEVNEMPLIVHPAFDVERRLWFVDEYETEAKSISDLLVGLRAETKRKVIAKDHYVNCRCPDIKYAMKTAEEFLMRPEPVLAHRLPKFVNSKFATTATTNSVSESRKSVERRPHMRQPGIPGVSAQYKQNLSRTDIARPRGAGDFATMAERKSMENRVLDMWAAGKSAPEIAIELGLKVAYVGANIIPAARKRGDSRAIVRSITYNVKKN